MWSASTGRGFLPRFFRSFLVTLLALGTPGTGFGLAASEPTNPKPGAAALSVASDPQGAAVFVNGELRGATPLTVNGMASGEHRVRVVKDGYLENSRVVSVKAGQPRTVEVRMTPDRNEARHALQQEPDAGGGGGGKKALWIGLGVAAVGAGAYFLLRDTNDPPSAGSVTASPNEGIAATTQVSFSAQGASDPDGDTLTFTWDFGDGATGSGQNTTHVYQQAGSFNARLTVSDGEESATTTTSVTIRNLTGTWSGTIAGLPPGATRGQFTQNGADITGTMTFPGVDLSTGNVSGRVTSPLNVTFTVSISGFQPFTFTGTVDPGATRLTGQASGSGFRGEAWSLTRQ
jgi:PKD repeat protein